MKEENFHIAKLYRDLFKEQASLPEPQTAQFLILAVIHPSLRMFFITRRVSHISNS